MLVGERFFLSSGALRIIFPKWFRKSGLARLPYSLSAVMPNCPECGPERNETTLVDDHRPRHEPSSREVPWRCCTRLRRLSKAESFGFFWTGYGPRLPPGA